MSAYEVCVCDECGKEHRWPAKGWLFKEAGFGEARIDLCVECLATDNETRCASTAKPEPVVSLDQEGKEECPEEKCPDCDGFGRYWHPNNHEPQYRRNCRTCKGKGRVPVEGGHKSSDEGAGTSNGPCLTGKHGGHPCPRTGAGSDGTPSSVAVPVIPVGEGEGREAVEDKAGVSARLVSDDNPEGKEKP